MSKNISESKTTKEQGTAVKRCHTASQAVKTNNEEQPGEEVQLLKKYSNDDATVYNLF
jgi:hypothetical protein